MSDTAFIDVSPELLRKYDKPGPRYTSYPTAPEWSGGFSEADYRRALAVAAKAPGPLSMYVHIPFCHQRCAYCGCNTQVAEETGAAAAYLDFAERELGMVAEALGERRGLIQFHWGGGTPTFLSEDEIRRLFEMVTRHFAIESGAEVSLEADARVTTHGQVALLRSLGFNRLSMGVQDLDPSVQEAIGRNQSEEQTRRLYDWGREAGFTGINFDLVYGLPGQTMDTWTRTIENVIDIGPDRLAVYSFAFLPERLHNQRRLDASALPTGEEKYALFAQARRMFVEAGYRAIGMDHFALPTDDLSAAMDERRLHRNFMGYTSMPVSDMVGIGLSSIGEIGGCYAQNEKRLTQYYKQLDGGKLPVVRGWTLSDDDAVRRWVIRQLMCNFYLDFVELKRRFGVAYEEYFAEEEAALAEFYANEFVARDEHGNIKVLPLGQVFVRNVAMVFDAYLKKPGGYTQFSRTV